MKKILCSIIIMAFCFAFSNAEASNTFYDTRGTKYEGVVERMAKLEIVNGMSETTYAPYKGVTRAELAKILTKIRGFGDIAEELEYDKEYSDVKKKDWFYPYVMAASGLGVVNGYEDGTFKPNQEVTYAELVAILLRNLGYVNIDENSDKGWYWNYILRMREIELNDNVGEFDYTTPAKRGDVAMFVWNSLITDRWAITMENEKEGFSYTYSDTTPLEAFFEDYGFLDNEEITSVGGSDGKVTIRTEKGNFYIYEKTPLYVLGGNITALYNLETKELVGVTFDEDYQNIEVVSGPKFYLEEQGYRPARATKVVSYGEKTNANYVYMIINKDTEKTIRTVYLDTTNTFILESLSYKPSTAKASGDTNIEGTGYVSGDVAFIEDGFPLDKKNVKKGDVITYLGDGLYARSNQKLTGKLASVDRKKEKLVIDEDAYIILDNCICYLYNEKEPVDIHSVNLKEYIDTEITVALNIAEEVCIIKFGKIEEEKKEKEEEYKFGFVTETYFTSEAENVKIDYGDEKTGIIKIEDQKNYVAIGDFIVSNKDEKGNTHRVTTKDISFKDNVSVKYHYDAKKIDYPMIGEYMVTEDTAYYKVSHIYEDNSVKNIKECKVEPLGINSNRFDDLNAYTLTLIYNEDMEVEKVYAINEVNKFDNQIALVKNLEVVWNKKTEKIDSAKASLSVIGDAVRGFVVNKDLDMYRSGDIITFTYQEGKETNLATLEEVFKKEFIGYKRDLKVKEINKNDMIVYFENGKEMNLKEDVYNWNGTKINLNKYRFVLADVTNVNGYYEFSKLKLYNKEKLPIKEGDRFAIGELQDVIVVYRGYKE